MRKLFEGAVNSKAWKLFTKLSDWKKSFKAKTLKALRKGLTTKKFRQNVATKWKASKFNLIMMCYVLFILIFSWSWF